MAVRGDEVAGSIDARVRESIEKMVAEIRSSIEDVRGAVDQQLKAALQSVQADVNSVSFLPQIRQAVADLEQALLDDKPAPAGLGSSQLKDAIRTIERGKSQVDVLNALLEQCSVFGSRAALLILRGDTFSGWKAVGFSSQGGNDDAIRTFSAAPAGSSELQALLREERVVPTEGGTLLAHLGGARPSRAAFIPMVIKDKVAAAVYVDVVEGGELDLDAVQLLVFSTGLLVDTLAIRKKVPSPSLTDSAREVGEAAPETNKAPATAPAPAPASAREPAQPVAPPPPPPPAVAAPSRAPEGSFATDPGRRPVTSAREMLPTQPEFNVPSVDEFSAPASTAAPPPAAPPPRLKTDPGRTAAGTEERPTTQYIPPPGLARSTPVGAQTDEAKKHDEARRFARLLVSEIKLYNEAKVDQGRKNNDLYERLKEDIDRSRQMYDERISDDVRKVSNYFYDELVRILADGKPDALGL